MSADILATVISEMKESPMFALQLDESTDVASCSQLLMFTRYFKDDDVKEEYLFELESRHCTSFSFGLLFGKDSAQTKQKQSSLYESPLFVAFVALSFFFCAFFLIVFLTTEGIPFFVSLAI